MSISLLVGQAGLEPAMPKAPDLQSGGVTNFPTDPYINALSKYMSNLSFDYLPVCARPGWNPDRLDTSRRIVKTGPVQAPVLGGSIRHARTFAVALFC